MKEKKWCFCDIDRQLVEKLMSEHDLTRLQAALLSNRNISEYDDVEAMFSSNIESGIEEPFAIADMDRAVERISMALQSREKICIFGDYDADGVTSTVMLYDYLTSHGADVTWCLPSRDEGGYGMNNDIIDSLASDGVKLIITVDNGVSALAEIAHAQELGLEVVVTDHHMIPENLPDCIIVDPMRIDCPSSFKGLCGAGVVFKLICAMEEDIESVLNKYGDLLTVATIADIVPLVGENRIIVRYALPLLEKTGNIGLRVLMERTGLLSRFGVQSVAFVLAPRINAAGRMGDAGDAVRLLLSETREEAEQYAAKLDACNQLRQQAEQRIFREACALYGGIDDLLHSPIGVVWGKDWESGVVGIVAAKLVENFGKPVMVISVKDGIGTGSARSVSDFSIYDAVSSCSSHLLKFGGHNQAVGITIKEENLNDFAIAMRTYAEAFGQILPSNMMIDGSLKLDQLRLDTYEQINELEPFGRDNPAPLFCLENITIKNIRPTKTGEHCMIDITKNGSSATLLMFGTNLKKIGFKEGDRADAVVSLSVREYNGNTELSVIIKDIRLNGFDEENYFNCKFEFDQTILYHRKPSVKISREDVAIVYRAMKTESPVQFMSIFAHKLQHQMPCIKVLFCLEILHQLGLLRLEPEAMFCVDISQKTDLAQSWLFRLANEQEMTDRI